MKILNLNQKLNNCSSAPILLEPHENPWQMTQVIL